ncbi:MAG: hypothetical protein FJ308_16430 [Planctomycetes bacterium]|nr:hypothetical protein [Planctomycetota bacterium]
MARYDDLNTNMIAYSAVLSIVVLVIVLQGTQALCYNMVNWADSKHTASGLDKPSKVKSEQLESLNGYGKAKVVDESAPPPAKGEQPKMKEVIHIPVIEAEKAVIEEFGATAPAGT